jgi:hypothetical protein
MSDVLRTRINCLDLGGEGEACDTPEVASALEIIPFYDVQLTWLARWNESPTNYPIDVSNEAISDHNAHSRGLAVLEGGTGPSVVSSTIHRGNLGLTGTDPIDIRFAPETRNYSLYVSAETEAAPPPLTGIIISGSIASSVGGVKAADVEIDATGAVCDRTLTGFECNLIDGDANPRLRIYNYGKGAQIILGCSDVLETHGVEHISLGGDNWTRFKLPLTSMSGADIVLRAEGCL